MICQCVTNSSSSSGFANGSIVESIAYDVFHSTSCACRISFTLCPKFKQLKHAVELGYYIFSINKRHIIELLTSINFMRVRTHWIFVVRPVIGKMYKQCLTVYITAFATSIFCH